MPFWNFIKEKFDKMPAWVQVLTYLILLGATVYLYLVPRFITGQIVARTDAGGYVPYRGVAIQTHVAGHTLKFTTNEDGYWTIPIVDLKPGAVKLQVFHEDDHSWFPIEIGVTEVWTEDFRIVVSDNAPFVNLELVAVSPAQDAWLASSLVRFLIDPAQAGELAYTRDFSTQQDPEAEQAFRAHVFEEVRAAVSDVTNLSLAELDELTPLERNRGLGYVQRIQVVQQLEFIYNMKIPDEHWRQFQTIGDLATYIADREEFAKATNLSKTLSGSSNWAQIQQSVAVDVRPKFIPNITAEEKRYWVVVGSHLSREDAERQAQKINNDSQIISAFVGVKVPPNEYFPVIIGGYLQYSDAEKLKSEVLSLGIVQEAYLSSGL